MGLVLEETQVVALADESPRIRKDEAFVELMRLARVANSLALAFEPILFDVEDQTPRRRRARFAALFYAAALLKEGLHVCRSLGKWFRELPQYENGIKPLLSDPVVQALETNILARVRNEVVFHFDREPISIGLQRLPDQEMVVCSFPTSRPEIGQTYFDAADDAILGYFFGDAPTDAEYSDRLEAFMTGTIDVFNRFLQASHRLIAMGLVQVGCKKRKGTRTSDDGGSAA